MNNIVLLAFVPMCWATSVLSQPAPDLTVTDTDGQVWHLYDQLSQGKTVVLDFFFVDCVPCQLQSPEVAIMYNDYVAANEDVLVLGISNRDSDADVVQFDQTYDISYPTAGEDGGGDTITDLYQSWYPFVGWPWYAVICPDSSLQWVTSPTVPGVPELRDLVDQCIGVTSVQDAPHFTDHVDIVGSELRIHSSEVTAVRIVDIMGRQVFASSGHLAGSTVTIPWTGMFVVSIELADQRAIHQKMIR